MKIISLKYLTMTILCSVADPDPGSGAFLPPGSGIRIWDGAMVGSGIRDKQTKFVKYLYTKRGRIRDPVLFYPLDPGSGAFLPPGSGIRIRDPDPGWSNGRIQDKTSWIRKTDSMFSRADNQTTS
jgi:hypothetical protein